MGKGLLLQRHGHSQHGGVLTTQWLKTMTQPVSSTLKKGRNAARNQWSTLVVGQKTQPRGLHPNHYYSYGSHTKLYVMIWSVYGAHNPIFFGGGRLAQPYDLSLAFRTQSKQNIDRIDHRNPP